MTFYNFSQNFPIVQKKTLASRAARRSLAVGVMMVLLEEFCGCFVLLVNVTSFLEKSGASAIPTNISTIFLGMGQLIGAYFAIFTVDKIARKVLYTMSVFGIGFCMFVIGIAVELIATVELHDSTFIKILPVLAAVASMFLANCGLFSLTFLILAEISPPNFQDDIFMICSSLAFIFTICALQLHTFISDTFGYGASIFLFSLSSVLGGLLTIFHLPETSGKTFEEISRMMSS